ncbi:MAG: tetratricopeptide repeat protein [Myxococcales bacterium]|nr:tetratricopeptide repeat protein [Myxococcales bacterium]
MSAGSRAGRAGRRPWGAAVPSLSRRTAAGASALLLAAACGGGSGAKPPGAPGASKADPAQAPASNPSAVARMVQGVQAAKEGQRERATSTLREAVALDAGLWEARYDLGVLLTGAGDLAGAEGELASAARLAPESQEVAVALAEVRRRRGEQRQAADGLSDFVHAHPNAVDARTLYVAALRDSGQIDKAIAEAREVLLRKPGDATALAELALSHLAKGEKEAAELLGKQALEANPKSAVTHRTMGLLNLARGDDADAFAEFRKASQADPQDTTSRLNMGVVLLRAGAYTKAEEQYREILKLLPDDRSAQVGLAAALRGAADAQHPHRLEEARALLERVLAGDAHDTSALFNLGVLYADFLKKPAEGAPYFKRFLADAPADHPLRQEAERYVSAANANAPPPPAEPTPPAPAPAVAPNPSAPAHPPPVARKSAAGR